MKEKASAMFCFIKKGYSSFWSEEIYAVKEEGNFYATYKQDVCVSLRRNPCILEGK